MVSQEQQESSHGASLEPRADGETGRIVVPGPRSTSAARLLEMTARDTDQWRDDARVEAAEVVAAARAEADALVSTARRTADELVETAQRDASEIVRRAAGEAEAIRAETAERRSAGEAEVARLQQVATDHSHRLREHLHEVLDRLNDVDGAPALRGMRRRDDS
ncbi:hypothetical protein L2K70_03530 [Nocardioides KLBMP 9356]|uniref:ATPase n=1 Tax=Nocardioides potassii TaxID=2911371 RepID=A0ABS9H883_9ACTN|nr:hypothetical protein [Nocardioides potassii]MCF6376664.1 hypothetical protein [Nocardioides potassii]